MNSEALEITPSDAQQIATEVAGSIDWQTTNIIEGADGDGPDVYAFIEASRPKDRATIALCHWLAGQAPLRSVLSGDGFDFGIVLMATTANSIVRVLRAEGYDEEADQITAALKRHDAAAQTH